MAYAKYAVFGISLCITHFSLNYLNFHEASMLLYYFVYINHILFASIIFLMVLIDGRRVKFLRMMINVLIILILDSYRLGKTLLNKTFALFHWTSRNLKQNFSFISGVVVPLMLLPTIMSMYELILSNLQKVALSSVCLFYGCISLFDLLRTTQLKMMDLRLSGFWGCTAWNFISLLTGSLSAFLCSVLLAASVFVMGHVFHLGWPKDLQYFRLTEHEVNESNHFSFLEWPTDLQQYFRLTEYKVNESSYFPYLEFFGGIFLDAAVTQKFCMMFLLSMLFLLMIYLMLI